MYETFYGLREKPFNLTPDPRFLYLSEMHKEAFAHLVFGIRNRVGFIMVTGEIGTGKTTICRSLLGQLDQDVELAFIFNPCLSPEELLRKINEDFGIRSRAISVKGLIDELNTYLLDRHSKNKNCVLVIDEAQNLTPPVLEQIRLLSNLETERQKLLQIVLIGQPELAEQLELPELRQLNQRITARYHLKPLGEKETLQYIAYRLRIAGGMRKVRFTRGAIKTVYRHSKGTPRVINAICDRAMLIGYAKETRDITRALVKQAAREIRGERVRAKKKSNFLSRYVPTPRLAAAAALIVLVGLFIVSPVANRLDSIVALLTNPPPPSIPQTQETTLPPQSEDPAPSESAAPSDEPDRPDESETSEQTPVSELPEDPVATETAKPNEEPEPQPEPVAQPETPEIADSAPPEPVPPPPPPKPPEEPQTEKSVGPSETPAQPEQPEAPKTESAAPARQPGVFDAIALVAAVVPQEKPKPETPSVSESAPEKAVSASESVSEAPISPEVPDETLSSATIPTGFLARLERLDAEEALKSAASSLLQTWGMALLAAAPSGGSVQQLREFAAAHGLSAEPLRASLTELEALNLPAFVRLAAGEKSLWVALLSTEDDGIRCSTGWGETATVPRGEFAKAYGTEAVVLWRDPAPDAAVLRPDTAGDQVRALQHRLRQLGRYEGELTGVYDAATVRAITRIQSETALKNDGMAGRQVRMVLSSWLSDFPTPGLHEGKVLAPDQTAGEPKPLETAGTAEGAQEAAAEEGAAPAEVARTERSEPVVNAAPEPQPEPVPAPQPESPPAPELPKTGESGTTNTEENVSENSLADTGNSQPEDGAEPPADNAGEMVTDTAPVVVVQDLTGEPQVTEPPDSRDVEALLTEEVYGEGAQEPEREVTSPSYAGAPLVPHRRDAAQPASGDSE